jgi:hypothetical protein
MVAELRAGRNSEFKAELEELLRTPWHFEGENGKAVMYTSGPQFHDYLGLVRWDD